MPHGAESRRHPGQPQLGACLGKVMGSRYIQHDGGPQGRRDVLWSGACKDITDMTRREEGSNMSVLGR